MTELTEKELWHIMDAAGDVLSKPVSQHWDQLHALANPQTIVRLALLADMTLLKNIIRRAAVSSGVDLLKYDPSTLMTAVIAFIRGTPEDRLIGSVPVEKFPDGAGDIIVETLREGYKIGRGILARCRVADPEPDAVESKLSTAGDSNEDR